MRETFLNFTAEKHTFFLHIYSANVALSELMLSAALGRESKRSCDLVQLFKRTKSCDLNKCALCCFCSIVFGYAHQVPLFELERTQGVCTWRADSDGSVRSSSTLNCRWFKKQNKTKTKMLRVTTG